MTIDPQISNIDIVVYVLALLGGTIKTVHTEDIAVKCFELAPSRFSWVSAEYRKKGWPDKEVVRQSLDDARRKRYGVLVDGKPNRDISKDGWRITSKGLQYIKDNYERIKELLSLEDIQLPPKDKRKFVKKIENTNLYKFYIQNETLEKAPKYYLTDMLGCNLDAPASTIRILFEKLIVKADLCNESDLIEFLNKCKSNFEILKNDY